MVFDRKEEFSTVASENRPNNNHLAGIFQEKTVPAATRLAGWAALVQTFGVQAPVRRPSVVSEQHVKASRRKEGGWNVFDKRYWPGESFGDQMGFALRHEDLDLLVLKRLFQAVPQDTVTAFVRSAPTGAPNRRAWFLYEFLTGRTLDIPDAAEASFTDLLDDRLYFTATPRLSRRHKVRDTLRAHSSPLMNFIEWRPTPERNVEVLNDTADLYRYFDCTEAAEFLYACVARAIDKDLPREIDFLRRNDEAMRRIMNIVEMPDRMAENLVRFIRLNDGKLGRKRREAEFEKLTDDEVASIEAIVREAFEGFEN